jgi:hypothetical protein
MAYGRAESSVIFTEDADLLVLAAQGITHAGLAYGHQNTRSIGYIVWALELIREAYEPDEMVNSVEFI